MPRPLRIEYENAYYHVMNRGAGRRRIFYGEEYCQAFLSTLEEAHSRFGLEVLAYCLMGNHYHLLVKTPLANLGRAMRHINGVYTQRHNRLRKTDGALFRGRYKAICVEEDSYQLQVSRYIHRNPLEAKMVDALDSYPWSSYAYYVSAKSKPEWLYTNEVLAQLGANSKVRQKYRQFVESQKEDELKSFYNKGNQLPYLGSEGFRDWIYQQREVLQDDADVSKKELASFRPSIDEIVKKVAKAFKTDAGEIVKGGRLSEQVTIARKAAMYLCQRRGDHKLKDIAAAFGLKRYGSASTVIGNFKRDLKSDKKLNEKINRLI